MPNTTPAPAPKPTTNVAVKPAPKPVVKVTFSDAALQLILESEGLDQPSIWPGRASGITIGFGDDLGHQEESTFTENWQSVLAPEHYRRLLEAIGVTGAAAHKMAVQFTDIHITRAQANLVFMNKTLSLTYVETRNTFPGFERLPLDVQGVLVSLVYNRGSRMVDRKKHPREREEMRAIRDEVAKPKPDLNVIAAQLRSMKRLFTGGDVNGLITRREAEAKLVERSAQQTPAKYVTSPSGKQVEVRRAQPVITLPSQK